MTYFLPFHFALYSNCLVSSYHDTSLTVSYTHLLYTSQAHVNEIATALEYMKEGKIRADELITKEVTLDTLTEEGFEYLIGHGPENIKVLIKIGEEK